MEEEKLLTEILGEIVKKYDLGPFSIFGNPEIKTMLEGKTKEERIEIIENLPIVKLAQIVKEIEDRKIKLKDLEKEIEERLKIDSFKSEKIAREIKERILPISVKEKRAEIFEKEISRSPLKIKKEKKVQDIYREPID